MGLNGLIKEAKEKITDLGKTIPVDYVEQKTFLEAVVISLEAVINFGKRYAALAKSSAAKEKNAARKKILQEIAC